MREGISGISGHAPWHLYALSRHLKETKKNWNIKITSNKWKRVTEELP